MKKKSILFVIDSLDTAGAEKSLVSLLSMLDYSRYSVELQLFAYGHPLEKLVPKEVNILKPLKYTDFTSLNLKEALKFAVANLEIKMLFSRLKYSTQIRQKDYSILQESMIFWRSVRDVIEINPNKYDIAISYAQGIPTYYVAEKVKAKTKFAWVNASLRLNDTEIEFQKQFYDQYEGIVAVSESAKEVLLETFSDYENKISVIYDINNPLFIFSMASIGNSYEDSFSGTRILTIGRLTELKGYDLALEACLKLRELGVDFRWYVLGKGPLKNKIEELIIEHNLEKYFVLLGVETNPYSFIKDTDIYVQTSRSEGFGLAIAEARMLNIPVVTTRFDAVYNQMVHEKNGLVVDMNADAVVEGILKLINQPDIRQSIINYLQQEKKGNTEEIEKFYQLIG